MSVEAVTMSNMTTGDVGGQPIPQPTPAEVLGQEAAPQEVDETPVPAPERPRERASDKFAVLARKEAEVFRKQQAVRQQQAELARQAEEIKQFQEMKRQARMNPVDALKQLGLTYEEVTEYLMNDNKPTPAAEVMTLKQELEDFKRQQMEEQKRLLSEQRAAMEAEQQATIEQFHSEVNEYVAQHADTYELTALYNGASLVAGVIEENFKQTQRLMSVPDAAKLVEEHFEELAKKAQATKKFAATQQKAASPQVPAQTQAPRMGPTLSNDLTARVAANPQRPRTDEDRIAAALARLEGR